MNRSLNSQILIESSQAFDVFQAFLKELGLGTVHLIVDENTEQYCLPKLISSLSETRIKTLVLEDGEENKSLEQVVKVWNYLSEEGLSRQDYLFVLAGGMLCDLAAFAASSYKRGIKLVLIPTTLLAMADASIGGKTGINFNGIKNHIGSFYPATAVYLNSMFLSTLDSLQLKSGFAELFKYGLILSKDYWNSLRNLDELKPSNEIIKQAMDFKLKVCNEDLLEQGTRKILNFGHTMGHALEAYYAKTDNPLTHGHAVALGMKFASEISFRRKELSLIDNVEIQECLDQHFPGLEELPEFTPLYKLMLQDKKNDDQGVQMVLLNQIGEARFDQLVTREEMEEALFRLR